MLLFELLVWSPLFHLLLLKIVSVELPMDYDEQNDKAISEIEEQVEKLQDKLKDRLEETQDIGNLAEEVNENAFSLERTSSGLETTSQRTKWLLMLELYKYYLVAGVIVFLILLYLYKSLFK